MPDEKPAVSCSGLVWALVALMALALLAVFLLIGCLQLARGG